MSNKKKLLEASGYQKSFIGKKYSVPLPTLSNDQEEDLAYLKGSKSHFILNYLNYSVVQNKKRKFPFFVAANINGALFKKLPRKDRWRLEPRLNRKHQWGAELYKANKSDFDKGHMTKREDIQWGKTDEAARQAAASSFYYTNAVPQAANLNRRIWKSLEDYILKKETRKHGLKINMFTGPVLSDDDPLFITKVRGEEIRIPTLFWKVVYFRKDNDQKLYKIGFLMGQEELLLKMGIIHPKPRSRNVFMRFDKANTYQVNMATIETLTQLEFPPAHELYEEDKPITLNKIKERVQARGLNDGNDGEPDFEIEGLVI